MAAIRINSSQLALEIARRGLHARDLACLASVSPATLSAALNGRAVSTATLRKIALALIKVSVIQGAEELIQPAVMFGPGRQQASGPGNHLLNGGKIDPIKKRDHP